MQRSPGQRVRRWAAWVLGALASLAALAALVIYTGSELVLRRTYPGIAGRPVSLPRDSLSLGEGKRLAQIYGCGPGCHGVRSAGALFFDEPHVARLVAPNLTRAVRQYSDAELERIVRRCIRPNQRSVIGMPSEVLAGLSDATLGRILAYLRSLPSAEGPGPSLVLGPLGRLGVVTGQFKTAVALTPPDAPPPPAAPPTDTLALGDYLAHTLCAECHGLDLRGDAYLGSINLAVVSAYSEAEFARLLATGVPRGGRQLGLMGEAARGRLVALTPAEVTALYAYLHSRVGQT
jgi:mono/diheme cytochrome c family protein